MDNYTKFAVFIDDSSAIDVDEHTNLTTPSVYILTKDFIIWKINEKQFHINLPCILCLLCAFIVGILGNGTVLYVYYSKLKRNNTVIFTIWLSACDLIGCFFLLFEIYDKRFPMYSGQNVILCKTMRFFDIFMNSVSAFFLLCIAFDRYFKVCKPLKRMSKQKIKRAIVSAFVVPTVCVWPMAIFHGPERRYTKFDEIYGTDCADDDRFSGTMIKKVFFLFVMLTILCSVVILVVLYSFIFHSILRWKRDTIGDSMIIRTDKAKNRARNHCNRCFETNDTHFNGTNESGRSKSDQMMNSKNVSDNEVHSPNTSGEKENDYKGFDHGGVHVNNHFKEKQKMRNLNFVNAIQSHGNHHFKSTSVGKDHTKIHRDNHRDNSVSLKDTNRGVHKKVIQRAGSNTSQRRSTHRSTMMFSVVSLLYILSFLPTVVMEAGNAFGAVYEAKLSVTVKQLVVVANVSYFLNGSLNPIVYFVFNKPYRAELYKLFAFR